MVQKFTDDAAAAAMLASAAKQKGASLDDLSRQAEGMDYKSFAILCGSDPVSPKKMKSSESP